MVMVDVFVPAVGKEYDFHLDEEVRIGMIIEEIAEMIAHKEHTEIVGEMQKLLLCDRDSQSILQTDLSLQECGIATGAKLILV